MGQRNGPNLSSCAQNMVTWLNEVSVPFWCANGLDIENGGFFEALDLVGRPIDVGFKRTRLTSRQIYAFSHAAMNGNQAAAIAAEHGYKFLIEAQQGIEKGTWNRLVRPDGSVLDATQDLYDLAFVLFALAWWHKLSGNKESIILAKNTIKSLEKLRHPSGFGFKAAADLMGPHQQNPHMHLLEGLLALYNATNDDYFIIEGNKIVDLLKTCFLVNGTLREYFDSEWRPVQGEQGQYIEPGHMAEWAWILYNYGKFSNTDVNDVILPMMQFVEDVSQADGEGLLPDIVLPDKSICKNFLRLWPQTEFLKGLVTVSELTGVSREQEICRTWQNIETTFLQPAPPGTWYDHFDGLGSLIVDRIPASSLYHISVAINEVARYEQNLSSQQVRNHDTKA
jgi:mannose/cellobiose epimerase-like protein (N-acyl-D-glucosamine 2-epimerase family)